MGEDQDRDNSAEDKPDEKAPTPAEEFAARRAGKMKPYREAAGSQ